MEVFKGKPAGFEIFALVCDLIMLSVLILTHIRYGVNMLFLIIPLILIGIYLVLFCVIPEEYCFLDNTFEIRHRFRRTVMIPYDQVFNYEATASDSFINIGQSNKVKIYYQVNNKKSTLICRPKIVESFVDVLKLKCPIFNIKNENSLNAFFDDTNREE